jgi:hypothetical protein
MAQTNAGVDVYPDIAVIRATVNKRIRHPAQRRHCGKTISENTSHTAHMVYAKARVRWPPPTGMIL